MSEENGPDVNSVNDNPKEDVVNKKEETLQDKENAAKDNESSEDGEPDKPVENEESSQNEATELENKIIRQIEYYFGDINLPRDKFLLEQTKKDDGWVSLETMLSFKRLAGISTDRDAIVTAITKSTNNLMEVSEDRSKIRRTPDKPVPEFNEARRNELMIRTVYVKGFPGKGINLDILIPFFSSFGSVENVQMRTYPDRATKKSVFKGSVFVIFKTKELAEEFLAKESVKFRDRDLIRKWQTVYFEEKKTERKERDEKRKSQRNARNAAKNEAAKNDSVKLQHDVSKGSIIKLKGFSGEVTREAIKKQLTELEANVAFIEFVKGDSDGWVRLHGENSAQPILDKLKDKPLVVCGSEIEAQLMEGEEEEALLEKTREALEKIRDRKANKGRRGKGRGGRGRGGSRDNQGDRKRKGSPTTEEEPPAKVEAVEEDEAAESD